MRSAIDRLPRTLELATEAVTKQTGWNIMIIVGGPQPRLGGKVSTLVWVNSHHRAFNIRPTFFSFHEGKTTDGKTFEGFLGGDQFEKRVMSKFDDFLSESFGKLLLRLKHAAETWCSRADQAECAARALNVGSKAESLEEELTDGTKIHHPTTPSVSEDDEHTGEKKGCMSQLECKEEMEMRTKRSKELLDKMSKKYRGILNIDEAGEAGIEEAGKVTETEVRPEQADDSAS
jgi:hypothetical protein